jgi:hypothetical protein
MTRLMVLIGISWLPILSNSAFAQSTTAIEETGLEMTDAEIVTFAVSHLRTKPYELPAFIEEDRRRVKLLHSYAPFETAYSSVCDAWEFASDAQLGMLGFSKTDDVVRIHMGRDLETLVSEVTHGYESNASFARGALLGNCKDKVSQPYDSGFESDRSIQCVLTFTGETLTDNGCTNVNVLLLEDPE